MPYSSNLYREVFLHTNGFALNWPLDKNLRIGDFFMIRDNRIAVLGNIYEPYFQLDIADVFTLKKFNFSTPALAPYKREEENPWQTFKPQSSLWQFTRGSQGDYQSMRFGKEHKNDMEAPDYNAYRISFKGQGGFFFSAQDVIYHRMPHFNVIYKEVIRRLTAQLYNFNHIFLVTELATADHISVGVTSDLNAELVLSVDEYPGENLPELFKSDIPLKVEFSKNMGLVKLREKIGPVGFRAQKLSLTTEAKDRIIENIYDSSDAHIDQYAIELIDNGLFQLFPKIEINPANATEFFQWREMTLQDIEALSRVTDIDYI